MPTPPLQGLQSSNPQNDPLGLALQGRAQAHRFQDQVANPNPLGPLPDPHWDAYFQAIQEAAGGKPVDFAGSTSPEGSNQLTGYNTNNGTVTPGATEEYGPRGLKLYDPSYAVKGLQKAGR